ncbi:undecaprenyl-diphosphate phosphatase [Sphingomonas sinipercae]|uniref:Undecaprenyl-diphosphatase n=1 Tax=Sphingomonas sinipercae TaxID=2714944 RepID=A0A6G7ZQA3_9SPHN|nr:undecaprenyl-diphosphate phosphatase [Sphingomonas sinipercae]QIL03151.1 undecaprenyl-diphosphate phosphatase [Sphingomonas sinipercae]
MPILLLVILLGIVEGLTEYLPVSSTGHLILATELLGFDANRWALFNVAIQPGAILAVVVLYWRTFRDVLVGMFKREASAWRFTRNLLIAFLPAVIIALMIGDIIDAMLENAVIVAWALIIGGFAILLIEKLAKPQDCDGVSNLTLRQSVGVGLVQCLAMIPGVSRSGATILGAMSLGVDRKTAAEFSFFLAVPTLSGATAMQLFRHGDTLTADMTGWILLGSAVSFVVAIVVVKAFISVVTRYGFAPFAWYRIIAGAAALAWLTMR